jgi:hypothetical protein
VIDAARAVVDLPAGVLVWIRPLAEAAVPDADRRARDRQRDAPSGGGGAMRRELEAIAGEPTASPAPRWRPGSPLIRRSSTSLSQHGGHARQLARARLRRLGSGDLRRGIRPSTAPP